MEESILTSIKKLLGISKECTDFDVDIITHINTVFMVLTQLGVGPNDGFFIENKDATWNDYVNDEINLKAIKTYIYLKVKIMFDPPTNSSLMESMQNSIKELEWRLNVQVESINKEV